ncbi:MAG: sigma-54-dependent Fis family transcriptional regulator [Rhodocyclaceae bacterium]|jgi:DNA-binding NtrC family response regulator|uniref:Transcriptional regulator n=1 Tax=Candidatus Desulfobacillus denitrificans TaxID=2608985 RepID=A0A809QV47_9PROT|nr:sigma-54-dependent Fis family transcriptional regulator [Rhodocyclaceae bacterium]OQY75702.1 MAG: transcriptional regulator [Rhodocyclaceae bacterium UTPRO2]BBO19323.1 transcriptional regulator [Candidatus Desulfobacillus denitrificans]GIK45496.1 MAG: transcriptional regulator [Betaproteobacteria bacterium]MBV6409326.1 Transcriptional regulatory protein ZraR [Rhodocyclaceae bacterium]
MAKILVVDDEVGIRELLSEILRDEGHDVLLAEHAAAARVTRNAVRPDLVLLDIWMPDTDGITLLKEWSVSGQLTMPVVMMSGHGTIDTAVEATRIGAQDFLEKPIALQKLLSAVKRALQKSAAPPARTELSLTAFARAAPLRDLKKRLDQVAARSRALMLKTGPGSLAELCARSLQAPGKPWLDLSGHGQPLAIEVLEEATGGMLFAEELAALSRLQQKNLAFALDRLEKFDLRLVAASTQSTAELAAAGFDEALARRLAEVSLGAPGLAELRDEVPEIAAQVLTHLIEANEVPLRRLSTAALNALRHQAWAGGYAELRNAVRSLALGALEEEIAAEEVQRLLAPQPSAAAQALPLDLPLREAREAFERVYFEHHLQLENGNMTRLAEKSGLERTHLYRKLKALGIPIGRKGEEQ